MFDRQIRSIFLFNIGQENIFENNSKKIIPIFHINFVELLQTYEIIQQHFNCKNLWFVQIENVQK